MLTGRHHPSQLPRPRVRVSALFPLRVVDTQSFELLLQMLNLLLVVLQYLDDIMLVSGISVRGSLLTHPLRLAFQLGVQSFAISSCRLIHLLVQLIRIPSQNDESAPQLLFPRTNGGILHLPLQVL